MRSSWSLSLLLGSMASGCAEAERNATGGGAGGEPQGRVSGTGGISPLDCNKVRFGDATVEAQIAQQLGTNVFDISALESIVTLSLDQVSSLDGFQCLPNLFSLAVEAAPVSDLSPLSGLRNLQSLSLGQSRVTELAPVASLAALRFLELTGGSLVDLSPLATLSTLEGLSISGSDVDDLGPLTGHAHLRAVRFANTRVDSVEPLANLPNLVVVDLSGTQVRSLSGLRRPPAESPCSFITAIGADLDEPSVNTTIPALCELGWSVVWSTPNAEDSCGPGCR